MRRLLNRSLVAVVLATTFLGLNHFSSEPLQAAGKKPAIPKFNIQFWDIPNRSGQFAAWEMNSFGQIAGWFDHSSGEPRIFLYDPAISATTAIDLNETLGINYPDGWEFRGGQVRINDNGVIFGTLSEADPEPGATMRHTWAFLLDTRSLSPEIIPLAELPGVTDCNALGINNNLDIVCSYKSVDGVLGFFFFNPVMHDTPYYLDPLVKSVQLGEAVNGFPAMVGGKYGTGKEIYRSTPELGQFSSVSLGSAVTINDMNNSGVMVGQNAAWVPMRIINSQLKTFSLPTGTIAKAVNNSGDIVFSKGYLYRDDAGMITLSSYVTGSSANLALWNSATSFGTSLIIDRSPDSNYGQVCGACSFADGTSVPFMLIPIVKTGR